MGSIDTFAYMFTPWSSYMPYSLDIYTPVKLSKPKVELVIKNLHYCYYGYTGYFTYQEEFNSKFIIVRDVIK